MNRHVRKSDVRVFKGAGRSPVGEPLVFIQTEVWPQDSMLVGQAVGFFTRDPPDDEGAPFVITEHKKCPPETTQEEWPTERLENLAIKTMKRLAKRVLSDRYTSRRLEQFREADITYTATPDIRLEAVVHDQKAEMHLFSLALAGLDEAHLDMIAGHTETWGDIKRLVRRVRTFTENE